MLIDHKHIEKGERSERARRKLSMVRSQWWEKIYDRPRNIGQVYGFIEVMLNRERKERGDENGIHGIPCIPMINI